MAHDMAHNDLNKRCCVVLRVLAVDVVLVGVVLVGVVVALVAVGARLLACDVDDVGGGMA